MSARIKEYTERISFIKKELLVLPSDSGMKEVNEKKSAQAELEKRQTDVIRTYAALSMTVSHVFRKAEKIATKKRQPTEIATIRHAIELLSDHTVPQIKQFFPIPDDSALKCAQLAQK